ncbi:MAG: hypothetical protein IKY38_03450, partial [Anaerotignum sp.]|nr:hypothetical protein [Anaerotignum sp.]
TTQLPMLLGSMSFVTIPHTVAVESASLHGITPSKSVTLFSFTKVTALPAGITSFSVFHTDILPKLPLDAEPP